MISVLKNARFIATSLFVASLLVSSFIASQPAQADKPVNYSCSSNLCIDNEIRLTTMDSQIEISAWCTGLKNQNAVKVRVQPNGAYCAKVYCETPTEVGNKWQTTCHNKCHVGNVVVGLRVQCPYQ